MGWNLDGEQAPGTRLPVAMAPARIAKAGTFPTTAQNLIRNKLLEYRLSEPGFGKLDRNPKVDFGHDLVEAIVAGPLAEIVGH